MRAVTWCTAWRMSNAHAHIMRLCMQHVTIERTLKDTALIKHHTLRSQTGLTGAPPTSDISGSRAWAASACASSPSPKSPSSPSSKVRSESAPRHRDRGRRCSRPRPPPQRRGWHRDPSCSPSAVPLPRVSRTSRMLRARAGSLATLSVRMCAVRFRARSIRGFAMRADLPIARRK